MTSNSQHEKNVFVPYKHDDGNHIDLLTLTIHTFLDKKYKKIQKKESKTATKGPDMDWKHTLKRGSKKFCSNSKRTCYYFEKFNTQLWKLLKLFENFK